MELPLEQFPTNRRMPDGHLGWCFECFKLRTYQRPKEQPKVEPIEVIASVEEPKPKRRRVATLTPEERKRRQAEASRRWKEQNRERCREQALAYYYKNKDNEEWRAHRKEAEKRYRSTEKYKEGHRRRNIAYYHAHKEKWVEYNRRKKERSAAGLSEALI